VGLGIPNPIHDWVYGGKPGARPASALEETTRLDTTDGTVSSPTFSLRRAQILRFSSLWRPGRGKTGRPAAREVGGRGGPPLHSDLEAPGVWREGEAPAEPKG